MISQANARLFAVARRWLGFAAARRLIRHQEGAAAIEFGRHGWQRVPGDVNVGCERFDRVADELDSERTCRPRWKQIQNSSSNRELAMFIRRILAAETRVHEESPEHFGFDVVPGFQFDGGP